MQSAHEISTAIECAYNNGEDCTANVKLCQENDVIFGTGYLEQYLGLLTPQYLIYYEKFPTKSYSGILGDLGFT